MVVKARLRLGKVASSCLIRIFACLPLAIAAVEGYAGTTTYTYDVHGRLASVASPNGSDITTATFTFDNADNRLSIAYFTQDLTPPNVPSGLSAVAQAFDRIRLNWTTVTDVGGGPVSYYRIYRGGSAVASPSAPPYDDQPLGANTPYTYRVSAVDPSGNESAQSSPASATTPPGADLVAPSVPLNLQGTPVSGTWINLTWGASTDTGGSGLGGYEVFRNGAYLATSTVASYSDQSLSPYTTYQYTVRAFDLATPTHNFSGFSNQVSVTTLDTVAPSAPGTPSFSAITSSSATVSWGAASDNAGVTGYRYSTNGGSSWTNVGLAQSASLSGLTQLTSYTVYVQAVDAANNWGTSSSNSFATTDGTPPSAPGAPSFSSIAANSATATWGAASDNVSVTGYRYSLNGGSSWTNVGLALSVNLTGLVSSTSYTMLVQAGDAAGNWGSSSSNTFVTAQATYTDTPVITTLDVTVNGPWTLIGGFAGGITPATTANGLTYVSIADWYQTFYDEGGQPYWVYGQSNLQIGGFSANPGAGWLISVNGQSMSAITPGFSNGVATWVIPQLNGPSITLVHH